MGRSRDLNICTLLRKLRILILIDMNSIHNTYNRNTKKHLLTILLYLSESAYISKF